MSELADNLGGRFIVFDGPDGAGKGTQLDRLEQALAEAGTTVQRVFDPGGTGTGNQIRQILLSRETETLSPVCETLLFMASRAQLLFERVRPAMDRGEVVLCDRFVSATLAYQGALGVDKQMILDLGRIATEGLWPDLTIILDLPPDESTTRAGSARAGGKGKGKATPGQLALFGDRMESRPTDYHSRVRDNFRRLGEIYPSEVAIVDASGSVEEVHHRVLRALTRVRDRA